MFTSWHDTCKGVYFESKGWSDRVMSEGTCRHDFPSEKAIVKNKWKDKRLQQSLWRLKWNSIRRRRDLRRGGKFVGRRKGRWSIKKEK